MTPLISYRTVAEAHAATTNKYDECPSCGNAKRVISKHCLNCRYGAYRDISQPNDPLIRHIPLTRGQVAIIDAKHYERMSGFMYFAHWSPETKSFYAIRMEKRPDGRQKRIPLHDDIMQRDQTDSRTVDHAFHNTLDNREFIDGKENLRFASHEDQTRNRRLFKNNTTGFKGVFRNKRSRRPSYIAYIRAGGKQVRLGTRSTAEAAHLELYVPAALKLHGKFARLK